jgi:hypothetical protein
MRKLRDNLPLAILAIAFVALALATQCTSATGDPSSDQGGAGQVGRDDSGTPLGCSKDADCAPPPSTCEGPGTLVYYTDGKCVQHLCQWQTSKIGCPGSSCFLGGCSGTTTAGSFGGYGGQAGDNNVGVEAGEAQDPSDAPIDHATVGAPDAGSCTEGNDASTCVVPPSVCADERWLAYFTNGSCRQNRCQWQVLYRDCGALGCGVGGCILNVTAK